MGRCSRTFFRWVLPLLTWLVFPVRAGADPGLAPSVHIGMFFEFGDEAGFAGGFSLWAGAAIYPSVDPDNDGAAFFLAPGLELRTGLIPFLTGPTELIPQLRAGVAWLGPPKQTEDSFSYPDNLALTDLRLQAALGYRFAFAFGLDNPDRRRKDEQALRIGLEIHGPGLWRLADPYPVPDMLSGMIDVNLDGSFDRGGFGLGFGF